jgi:hypothetical protein
LARIYLGEVTSWRDPAIIYLNQGLQAKLPDANISMGFVGYDPTQVTDFFARALSNFSGDFAAAYSQAGSSFSALPPFAEGRAFNLTNSTGVVQFLKVGSPRIIFHNY